MRLRLMAWSPRAIRGNGSKCFYCARGLIAKPVSTSCGTRLRVRPRLFEIGGRVDGNGRGVGHRGPDGKAELERPQLLQLLAPLERRRRRGVEALERCAPVAVDADVAP